MQNVHDGQCGLCSHFGEHGTLSPQQLEEIRKSHQAKEEIVADCGHPRLSVLHLQVTPHSGCDGFEPAAPDSRS